MPQIPQTGGLKNWNVFPHVLEAGSPWSRCWQSWILLGPLSLACTELHLAVLSQLPFSVCSSLVTLSFFIRIVSCTRVPALWPHISLVSSVKVLCPNIITLEVKTSTYEFWRKGHKSVHISDIIGFNTVPFIL